MVLLSLLLIKSFNTFCWNIPSICFNSFVLSEIFKSFIALTCSFVNFSYAFPDGE